MATETEITKELAEMFVSGKLKPIQDIVVMKSVDDDKKLGRFYVPTMHTDKDMDTDQCYGVVVSTGPGLVSKKGILLKLSVKVGDKIVIRRGACMRYDLNGEALYIAREPEILGVIE